MEHAHEYQGQKLTHSHEYGNLPHGYFEHDEDDMPRQSITAERARLMADQHRIARELNEFSQRSGYAISHTESPRYRELCAQAEANTARLRELNLDAGDAVSKLYGEGIDEEADEVYLPALGRCRYCSELIQPVVIKSSGLVDWEIDGDTGCGQHPDNDDEGTCGHEPLPVDIKLRRI